jgi:hypothetical protein
MGRNPFIAYISQQGELKGCSLGRNWRGGRRISGDRFLMTKHMGLMDFWDILSAVVYDIRENRAQNISMLDYAEQRLLACELPKRGPDYRPVSAEIYIVTLENEFPDDLMHPGDLGGGCQPM